MTSKSSGKEPPSVGSVIMYPPVRFDWSSSVSTQPFDVLRRAMYTPSEQSYPYVRILVPQNAPAGTNLGQPGKSAEESRCHTCGPSPNDLCIAIFILQSTG